MKVQRYSFLLFCCAALYGTGLVAKSSLPAASPDSEYRLIKTFPVGGDEGWDYVGVDSNARRVYVSHGTRVVVLDADSGKQVGEIADTQGVHGIALAPDLGKGFTSNGRANTVSVFDLKTVSTTATVKVGTNPDAIVYDRATKRVFTMNGRSQDTTAISAADGTVLGTVALGGKPEFVVSDGAGSLFVNIEDKSELVQFDPKKLSVVNRWPMAPCEEPSGLAIDAKTHRLFAGCSNKILTVLNASTGKVVTTLPIGEGVDANGFDPGTNLVFSSNGDGTLTVVHEDSPDKYTVIANVPTKKSARTMGLDLKTHNIFLPAADFDPPAPGERRGKVHPGSFVVLLVGRS
jgi:YVTN family beta-propeller protein